MAKFMETCSGQKVDFLNPDPDQIFISDIAWHLSKICRYTGATRKHYSVAQHCVLLADYTNRKGHSDDLALAVLMHDAQEAYIGDVSSPLKALLPNYQEIEERFEKVIRKRYDLATKGSEWFIGNIDYRILMTERAALLPNTGRNDWGLPVSMTALPVKIRPWPAWYARRRFLKAFKRYSHVDISMVDLLRTS